MVFGYIIWSSLKMSRNLLNSDSISVKFSSYLFSIYCWGHIFTHNMQMLACLAVNPFLCVMNLCKEKIRNYGKRSEAI